MVLRQMQFLLGRLYDVELSEDVYDFLVTDPRDLPAHCGERRPDEQLIVAQSSDELGVGLYLDGAVLERLARANPHEALNERNLADFLTALEGVSHFVYVAWNARHDKAVSLLELEMQAEVDKYVAALSLLRAQWPGRFPRELHAALFERTRVDARIAGDRFGMYRLASDYAARYCRQLMRGKAGSGGDGLDAATLAELRRFYRLADASKLAHIRRRERVSLPIRRAACALPSRA